MDEKIRTIKKREDAVSIDIMIKNLPDVDFDFQEIKRTILKFYSLVLIRKKPRSPMQNVLQLIRARTYLNNALVLTKSNITPERNEYILEVNKSNKSFEGFNYLLGIANGRLDLAQRELDTTFKINRNELPQFYELYLESFKELLIEYMHTFIIYPYKNAYNKFIGLNWCNKEGEPAVKDRDLFFYVLFLELYRTAEVEGALARQVIESGSSLKIRDPKMQYNAPPDFPPNLKYIEDLEENQIIPVADPFEVEGGEYETESTEMV